jgi:hypothetical protein
MSDSIWTWSIPQLELLVLIFLAQAPILSWSPLQLGFTWSPYWIGLVLAWCFRVYIYLLSEAKKISSTYPTILPEFFTRMLIRVLPERLTRSGCSYPALPDLLTWADNTLSTLSRNLLHKLIACQRYVLQTQLSPCRSNLVYTLPGRQPVFTFTDLLPDLAYLVDNPFLPYPTMTSLLPYWPLTQFRLV